MREYCRACVGCARVKRPNRPHREGVGNVPVIGEPFAQWSADILGPLPRTDSGNVYILIVSDLFTKWVEAFCIPDQKATTVADCFVELISRFGVPKSILTDQGTNFESALVKRICEMLGITKLRCTAAHPQTDGQTERFNRTLCDSLTHYVNANQTDWDRWVCICVSAFRFSRHSTTGYSPFELVYGTEPRVPVTSEIVDDADQLACGSYRDYVRDLRQNLSVNSRGALHSLEESQRRSSVEGLSDLKVGDKVMLKVHAVKRGTVKKLSDRYDGPYMVTDVRRPDYAVARGRKKRFVHGSNLKKVHASVRDDVTSADVPGQPVSVDRSERPMSSVGVGESVIPTDVPRRPSQTSEPCAEAEANAVGAEADDDVSVCSSEDSDSSLTGSENGVYVTMSGRRSKPAVRYSP